MLKIPLNIFQTWHTTDLPAKMKESVESLKLNNPEFNHYLYDDNDCREFIKKYYKLDTLEAYDALIPGAYKADLWRYCVLYKLGGVYLDVKYQCVRGFKLITLMDEEHFVRDHFDDLKTLAVYNAFMVCLPGNEILLKCINKVIYNVKNNIYSNSSLGITGPHMMIQFFTNVDKVKLQKMTHKYININECIIMKFGLPILKMYNEYRLEQRQNEITIHYNKAWNRRKVYREIKPITCI
jgi:mannosyltransferase OCH1-like enzyme